MNKTDFENIYDRYSPMLYGVALQICPVQKNAEELLLLTFKKIHDNNIGEEKFPSFCITLIRLIITTAKDLYPLKFKNNFSLKYFEKAPVLNNLLCNQVSLDTYSNENQLTKEVALQLILKEVRLINDFENGRTVFDNNTVKTVTLTL